MKILAGALQKAGYTVQNATETERSSDFFAAKIASDFIEPALRSIPDLVIREGKFAVVAAGSASSFNLTWLAQRFADRLLFGFSPEEIASDFEKRLETNNAEAVHVALIYGVSIDKKIQLEDDIWICNSNELNEIPGLTYFLNRPHYATEASDTWLGPRIAVCQRYIEPRVLREIPSVGPWRDNNDAELEGEHEKIMFRLIDVLTLIVNVPLLLLRQTTICTQPGSIGMSGLLSRGAAYQTMIPHAEEQCVSGAEVKSWFDGYFNSPMWSDLEVSISRLRSSRVHFDSVNRAIDLGISLEAALMRSDPTNTEITNKISARFAWLVGDSADDRRVAARRARKLYRNRSSAVHKGVVKDDFDDNDAYQVCQSTLKAMVKLGRVPDWDDIVFGP